MFPSQRYKVVEHRVTGYSARTQKHEREAVRVSTDVFRLSKRVTLMQKFSVWCSQVYLQQAEGVNGYVYDSGTYRRTNSICMAPGIRSEVELFFLWCS